jgi:hypothetical protein
MYPGRRCLTPTLPEGGMIEGQVVSACTTRSSTVVDILPRWEPKSHGERAFSNARISAARGDTVRVISDV